jgi:hypothetical protein
VTKGKSYSLLKMDSSFKKGIITKEKLLIFSVWLDVERSIVAPPVSANP